MGYMSEFAQLALQPDKRVAVSTHPHKGTLAIKNAEWENFRSCCPTGHKRIRHARRGADVLRPVVPEYVFSKVDTILPAFDHLGVGPLVLFGERLRFFQDDFIQTLMAAKSTG